jgi:FAD/FMN-containing dehydrogenase
MPANLLHQFFPSSQTLTDKASLATYGTDWTGISHSLPEAVFFPHSLENVQKIVLLANEHGFGLVPSGGRTGLSGGAIAGHGEVVVSFEKMNKILSFNEIDKSITVQAGVLTQEVQRFAANKNLLYPLDFASKGSSQIGGNIATNAGGVRVVRYGSTRNWVRGLTVVTGKGDILYCNRGLLKDASGYDLRHLFIGSEGSLGFIVEAELGLTPVPKHLCVALLALNSLENVTAVFQYFRNFVSLNAFEIFSSETKQVTTSDLNTPFPLKAATEAYILLEWEGKADDSAAIFEFLYKKNFIEEDVIAEDIQERARLWSIRENIPLALTPYKPYKNDISLRPSSIPAFLIDFEDLIKSNYAYHKALWFGHIGDGNLHLNLLKPNDMSDQDFREDCDGLSKELYALVAAHGGSASAEHGIGLLKHDALPYSRGKEEIQYMKAIKQVFDPRNVMNPGKLL